MDYNTRLQSNNAELNEIYNALISLPETESDVIRLQYDPGEQIENAQAVYEAFQNGKYILVEGEHTFFSTKTGNTVTATFAIPLISANSDYTFEFKGADSYDNVIYLAYIQVLGWVDVIIERGDPKLQDKATTPNQWTQTIQADFEEYDGLGVVTVYPIPDEYIVPSGTLEIIENGEYDVTDKADVIVSVESAPVAVEEKDVNFYDYDGTCLYSYTLAEAQALSSLPPLPEHDGLTCQKWNWTLADIKALPENTLGADIGAVYITADGKTHCYFEFVDEKKLDVTLNFTGTLTIEWGDGTTTSSATSPASHTYASTGTYLAKLYSASAYKIGGGTSALTFVTGNVHALKRLHLASNATLHSSGYALYGMRGLETATVHTGELYKEGMRMCGSLCAIVLSHMYAIAVQSLQDNSSLRVVCAPAKSFVQNQGLRGCTNLKRFVTGKESAFGDGYHVMGCSSLREIYITGIGAYACQSTFALRRAILSENITSIGAQSFYNSGIQTLNVPENVTSIGTQAFQYCSQLVYLKFNSTTPPTVANANAFAGVPTTCIVEVPAGALATYQAATNYGTIAAQMVEG